MKITVISSIFWFVLMALLMNILFPLQLALTLSMLAVVAMFVIVYQFTENIVHFLISQAILSPLFLLAVGYIYQQYIQYTSF